MSRSGEVHILFLHRRFRTRLRRATGVIGVVPLADVVLVFVLFALLNSAVVLKPGVLIDLPRAALASGAHGLSAVLKVSRDGTLFFDDQRVRLELLGDRFEAVRQQRGVATLLIEADRRITQQQLMALYDVAQQAGFEEIVLGVDPVGEAP
jgi:biopolymer transport protein ExbD